MQRCICLTGKGEKYTIPNYPIRKYQKVTGLFRKAIEAKPFDKMDKCNSHYSEPTYTSAISIRLLWGNVLDKCMLFRV